tara:strand:+ start:11330 stop:12928 length:1599 start_codon:yes stop_codon:yes gene_type:complete
MKELEPIEILDDLNLFLNILPSKIKKHIKVHEYELIEVVMDLGRPPIIIYSSHQNIIEDEIVNLLDISLVLDKIGHVGDDNRAGIEKTLHRISLIRNRFTKPVGLTCRVGRAVFGSIKVIEDFIGTNKSILIMGKPGIGKTTMLREITRLLADKEEKRVVVVDTSNEIAGDGDIPHPAIGSARRMQVKNTELQHDVMIEAVENHMPEVIVIDEISTEKEANACRTIAERGVQLIATAHGNTLDNLIINPTISDLVGGTKSVTLGDIEARRRKSQKTVLERQHEPTFDIVVEIIGRNEVAVHFDVALAVDKKLRGISSASEVRKLSNNKVEKNIEIDEKISLSQTPFNFSNLVNTKINIHDLEINTKEKINPKKFKIYPFGIQKTKLKNSSKTVFNNITIVSSPEKAEVIVTTKSNYSREPKSRVLETAEKLGIPIHILRKGSSDQIIRFLGKIKEKSKIENPNLDIDSESSHALNEVKVAVKKIQLGENEVELAPRDANIRRRQHFFASNKGIGTKSVGKELNRRLILKKRD